MKSISDLAISLRYIDEESDPDNDKYSMKMLYIYIYISLSSKETTERKGKKSKNHYSITMNLLYIKRNLINEFCYEMK